MEERGAWVGDVPGVAKVEDAIVELTLNLQKPDPVVKLRSHRVVLVRGKAEPGGGGCNEETRGCEAVRAELRKWTAWAPSRGRFDGEGDLQPSLSSTAYELCAPM